MANNILETLQRIENWRSGSQNTEDIRVKQQYTKILELLRDEGVISLCFNIHRYQRECMDFVNLHRMSEIITDNFAHFLTSQPFGNLPPADPDIYNTLAKILFYNPDKHDIDPYPEFEKMIKDALVRYEKNCPRGEISRIDILNCAIKTLDYAMTRDVNKLSPQKFNSFEEYMMSELYNARKPNSLCRG